MIPNTTYKKFIDAKLDLTSDTLKVSLGKDTTSYTPDPDSHDFVADVFDSGTTGEEFDGTNYARQSLDTVTTAVDDANNRAIATADDTTFPSLGSSTGGQVVQFIVIYKQVGGDDTTPSDDQIVRVIDDSEFSELPKQTNGEDFTIEFNDIDGFLSLGE